MVFRLGNVWIKPIMTTKDDVPKSRVRFAYMMLNLSWLANLAVFAFCLWWSVASARGIGPDDANLVRHNNTNRAHSNPRTHPIV